jgi:DNA-binding response OmpR family regulator
MIRVLYVDDEPDIREIAELALSLDPEFEVRTAASGIEALSLAEEWRPAIILLDVMMPVMDGPAVLSQLRERGMDTPVLFVTARAQRAEVQSFSMLDARGVIAKPFDPVSLAVRVRGFL